MIQKKLAVCYQEYTKNYRGGIVKRLIHQLQESLGVKHKVDQELLADILVHCIASRKTLEEAYVSLVETFGSSYPIDIDIMKRVAQQKETVMLIDNDRAISLWARLLPAYNEHRGKETESKVTSIDLSTATLHNILVPGEDSKGKYKSAFSRARSAINNALPKGIIMVCHVRRDSTRFVFVSAMNHDEAHSLLIQVGCATLSTIDKVTAHMKFSKEPS